MINTTKLKRMMANIGARKATKNTTVFPMKHLCKLNIREYNSSYCVIYFQYSQSVIVPFTLNDDVIRVDCHWNDDWNEWSHYNQT